MKILCFGEILFDIFGNESKIGGAPFNFAAHAARAGAQSYLVSAVGHDALGDKALRMAAEYGVHTDYISRSEKHQTGVCRVTLDREGIPQYDLVDPVAYDDIELDENIFADELDALYFGTLALRNGHNREQLCRIVESRDFDEVLVDVNVRHPFCKSEALFYAFENATIIKISDEELHFVMQELFARSPSELDGAVRIIAQAYPKIKLVLITCGANGSIAYDIRRDEIVFCPAVKTEVVSTVGAGDSYAATFLVNYLGGETILESMRRASVVSAYVVSRTEAIPNA